MDVQILSPEVIQDTNSAPTPSNAIAADLIDSTFGTTCIGSSLDHPEVWVDYL